MNSDGGPRLVLFCVLAAVAAVGGIWLIADRAGTLAGGTP